MRFRYVCFIIAILFVGIVLFISAHYLNYDKVCLREKATNYCSQHNMKFDKLNRVGFENYFTCKKDLRADEENRFLFLDSEMKECKK